MVAALLDATMRLAVVVNSWLQAGPCKLAPVLLTEQPAGRTGAHVHSFTSCVDLMLKAQLGLNAAEVEICGTGAPAAQLISGL